MPKILRKLANKLAECAGEWLLLFYTNVISKVYSGRLNTKDEVNSINIKIPKIVGEQSNLEIECIFLKGRCMRKRLVYCTMMEAMIETWQHLLQDSSR